MAIDTAERRRSAIDFGKLRGTGMPIPKGSIDEVSRVHILNLYAGIFPVTFIGWRGRILSVSSWLGRQTPSSAWAARGTPTSAWAGRSVQPSSWRKGGDANDSGWTSKRDIGDS